MEVDPSIIKFRDNTNYHRGLGRLNVNNKSTAGSDRATGQRRQKIDYIQAGVEDGAKYADAAQEAEVEIDEETDLTMKAIALIF